MTIATYIQDDKTVDHTPGAAVAAGDVVVQGDLIGVAIRPIAAGTLGALAVTGQFRVPKATGGGTAIGAGVRVHWIVATRLATHVATGNPYMGKAVAAAADGAATVTVRLDQ